jgi:hypothetical protein
MAIYDTSQEFIEGLKSAEFLARTYNLLELALIKKFRQGVSETIQDELKRKVTLLLNFTNSVSNYFYH